MTAREVKGFFVFWGMFAAGILLVLLLLSN